MQGVREGRCGVRFIREGRLWCLLKQLRELWLAGMPDLSERRAKFIKLVKARLKGRKP